jgi:hypothetical protein
MHNLSLNVFIKQIFRAAEQATPFPILSPRAGRGVEEYSGCFHPIAAALVMAFKP